MAPTADVNYLLAQWEVALAYLCGFPAGWTGAQVKQKLDLGDAPDADARTGGAAQSFWAVYSTHPNWNSLRPEERLSRPNHSHGTVD